MPKSSAPQPSPGGNADVDVFRMTPDPSRPYEAATFRSVFEHLARACQSPGLTLVLGASGIGKTALLGALRRKLQAGGRAVAFIGFPRMPLDGIAKLSLEDLGATAADGSADVAALKTHCATAYAGKAPAVIIVDDAQYCTDDVLDGLLRLLAADVGATGIHLILAGEPALRDVLARVNATDSAAAAQVELAGLDASEIKPYIAHGLQPTGRSVDAMFQPESLDRIAAFSQGVPRVINHVCRRALLLARNRASAPITVAIVDEAIGDYHATRVPGTPRGSDLVETLPTDTRPAVPSAEEPAQAIASAAAGAATETTAPRAKPRQPSAAPAPQEATRRDAPVANAGSSRTRTVPKGEYAKRGARPKYAGFIPRRKRPAAPQTRTMAADLRPVPPMSPRTDRRRRVGLAAGAIVLAAACAGAIAWWRPDDIAEIIERASPVIDEARATADGMLTAMRETLAGLIEGRDGGG